MTIEAFDPKLVALNNMSPVRFDTYAQKSKQKFSYYKANIVVFGFERIVGFGTAKYV